MATPGEAVVVRLPERFEAFYEREYHRVVGFAYAVAGSWEAAEDATQEAFLRAHRCAAGSQRLAAPQVSTRLRR